MRYSFPAAETRSVMIVSYGLEQRDFIVHGYSID